MSKSPSKGKGEAGKLRLSKSICVPSWQNLGETKKNKYRQVGALWGKGCY